MARPAQSSHPIQTLRDAIKSLETSLILCLARPGKTPVHALRTSIRRIEAHLELLSLLPELSPHHVQARTAHRLLRQLRRAAGKVRDRDVQRGLIQQEASRHQGVTQPDRDVRTDARHLRRRLKQQREEQAIRLQHLLHRKRNRLARVFEALLDAVLPAESMALSQSQLTSLILQWYGRASGLDRVPQDPRSLHRIRKRAKLARYLAESAPQPALAARRLAARFAALQQAGGHWHDWLILANLSAKELGSAAALSRSFAAHQKHALRDFQRRIRNNAGDR